MNKETTNKVVGLEEAAKKTVEYLYPIKGDVKPELAEIIGLLRQLINEEFVGKNKSISSQILYDILNPKLEALITQETARARLDELRRLTRTPSGFRLTPQHIKNRIKELEKEQ